MIRSLSTPARTAPPCPPSATGCSPRRWPTTERLTDVDTARSMIDQDGTLGYDRFSYDSEHYLTTRRAVDERIMTELARRESPRG